MNMRPILIYGFIGLAFSACSIQEDPKDKQKTDNEKYAEYAQIKVKEILKDPESAQFKDVNGYARSRVACGEVNSKNSYGGYVGFRKFSFYEGRAYIDKNELDDYNNFKEYAIGSGRCMDAESRDKIEELKNDKTLPKEQNDKFIKELEKIINDRKNNPIFNH